MQVHSILSFVAVLGRISARITGARRETLEDVSIMVQREARRVLGTHDYGWPALSPATLEKKAADTPGLETAQMRDSIQRSNDGHTARVGSDLDKAIWFELGTVNQPPRSFLVEAAVRLEPEIVRRLGATIRSVVEHNP